MTARIYMLMVLGYITFSCKKAQQVHVLQKDIIETVYASGKIVPDNEYNLFAFNNGTILKKLVKDGDRVGKGQILYVVRNEPVAAKYQAALAGYRNTELNLSDRSPLLHDLQLALQSAGLKLKNDSLTYHRWKNLWDQGIGTRSNLDNSFTAYQLSVNQQKSAAEKYTSALHDMQVSSSNARSLLQAARKELDDHFIRSDRAGIVYQTFREAGEGVHANEIVALIGDSGRRIIRLSVDQEDIDKIRTGQRVVLKTDLSGDKVYEATVTHIYPTMNESDQTFRVDAVFVQQLPPAFIHCSVEANIIIAVKPQANVLQREALAGEDSVWILANGKEKKVSVRTGIATLDYVEILAGIDARTPVLLKKETGSR